MLSHVGARLLEIHVNKDMTYLTMFFIWAILNSESCRVWTVTFALLITFLVYNVVMHAPFSLLLQWQQQCCTRPSLSLMGYQPPRCLEPSGSCCCWAPSTVRSSPPGPRNLPPAAGGRDAGNNREKKREKYHVWEGVSQRKRKKGSSKKGHKKRSRNRWITQEWKKTFKYQDTAPRKSG